MSIIALALLLVVYAVAAPAVMRAGDPLVRYGAYACGLLLAGALLGANFVTVDKIILAWGVSSVAVATVVALLLARRAGRMERPARPVRRTPRAAR